jgi:hypothetical protein
MRGEFYEGFEDTYGFDVDLFFGDLCGPDSWGGRGL